jgi:hypothetical protein
LAFELGVHFHAGSKNGPQVVEAHHLVPGQVLHDFNMWHDFVAKDGIQNVKVILGFLILLVLAKLLEKMPSIVEGMKWSLESELLQLGVETSNPWNVRSRIFLIKGLWIVME